MTAATFQRRFEDFWFAPEPQANLAVARALLAATALWVILSRPDLPSVLGFPSEMWSAVPFAQLIRFGYLIPLAIERALYVLLHVLLAGAVFGIAQRATCIASGILLIHFAPLESILWTPNPYLRGLTIPALGLLVFGFAGGRDLRRWPLLLTQLFFAQIYFFAGYAKIFTSGFEWIDAENIRRYLLLLTQFLGFDRHAISYAFVDHPLLCAWIAWMAVVFDLAFPIVLWKPVARWFMIPLALIFHIANAVLFHVVFQDTVLLLLFVNWQWVAERMRAFRSAGIHRPVGASS